MINDNPFKHILSFELSTGKKTFFLEKHLHSIGRSSGNSIIINHKIASRYHSLIIKCYYHSENNPHSDIAFWIVDGNLKGGKSRNGIFINGKKTDIQRLDPGDIIIFGGIEVRAKYDIIDIKSKEFFSVLNKRNIPDIPYHEDNHNKINNSFHDYQELKNLEENHNYQNTISGLIEGIIFLDVDSLRIIDCNQSFVDLLGYHSPQETSNLKVTDIFPLDTEILNHDINLLTHEYDYLTRDSIIQHKEGQLLLVQLKVRIIEKLGKKIVCISVLDLTEQKKIEELLRYQTYHDPITNLPNNKLFQEHLFSILANYNEKEEESLLLLLVKINEWKEIGFNYNYEVAELIIKNVSKKFKKLISSKDTLYRWRDDEFAFLIEQNAPDDLEKIQYQILEMADEPLIIQQEEIQVSFSIGASSYPQEGDYGDILLQKADRTLTENYYEYVKGRC